jgi:hypothetical protein
VVALVDHRDIDIDDVAGLQPLVVRDAVADHVVDRRTDGLREPAIAQVRRHGLLRVDDEIVAPGVQLLGGDPRLDVFRDHVEDVCGEAAGHAHFLLIFRRLDGDVHVGLGKVGRDRVRHCLRGQFMV